MRCAFGCGLAGVIGCILPECGSQVRFLLPVTLCVVSQSGMKLCGLAI